MRIATIALVAFASVPAASAALAQEAPRALAAGGSATVVQVVQQAINILPPASSQAFYFDYDESLGVITSTERVGSTVFREPRTLPEGRWAVRGTAAYFGLSGRVATEYQQRDRQQFAAYGTELSVNAGIFSLAATYGLTSSIELELGIPITIVDASQTLLLPVNPRALEPPVSCNFTSSRPCPRATVPTLQDARTLARGRPVTFEEGGVDKTVALTGVPTDVITPGSFSEGTSVGLGRVSVGSKVRFLSGEHFALAALPQVFLPSPSSDEFAGPDSTALAIGVLGSYAPESWLQAIVDVGYEWDTESTALTRFAWSAGVSLPTEHVTIDLGMSGSVYQNGVAWSPKVLPDAEESRSLVAVDEDAVRLDSTFAELLIGFKVPLGSALALSGSVAVPVDGAEFRPAALGTIGVEAYF